MFNRICLAIFALLICSHALPATAISDRYTNEATAVQIDTDITQGYRVDTVKWKSAKSSITIKNQQIYQTRLRAQLTKNDYFLKLMAGYGFSPNSMSGNYTTDAQIAFGKNFHITPKVTLSPLAGYNWSRQNAEGTVRKFGRHDPIVRRQAAWNAPFIGGRAALQATDDLNFFAEYDFLFASQYHGKSNWNNKHKKNLYFRQHSSRKNGFGHIGTIGAGYKLSTHSLLSAEYQLSYMHSTGGKMNVHGHRQRSLQKANLLSSEIRLAFNYSF